MANVNLYIKYDFTDDAGNLYSDGSTTTAKTISITNGEIFDRTYVLASSPTDPTVILSDDLIGTAGSATEGSVFNFLYIESDQTAEIQLLCNENGVSGDSVLENGFIIKLKPNIPFVLASDASRNRGADAADDVWEDSWVADVIDRIEFYHQSGANATVRVFAVRTTT